MAPVAWIGNFMWWLCDALGTVMTLTGLVGLLYLAARGLIRAMQTIIDKEEANEYQNRPGEENRPFQP